MKIFLANQQNHFPKHLELFKSKKVLNYRRSELKEKNSRIEVDVPFGKAASDLLFKYQVFPPSIMGSFAEWEAENREMQVGDTIVQQVFLPPFSFSLKFLMAVRICEIIDLPGKKGFSYETIEGHVEKGISTFTAEKHGNQTIFRIHTFSRPGNVFSRIAAPFFSIPYQTFCTRKALENLKSQAESFQKKI